MSLSKERETLNNNMNIEILLPQHELDSFNGEELKMYVSSIIDNTDAVIINFSNIVYLNSSGLRELIQILMNMRDVHKPLIFTAISEDILKVFTNTNLNRLFQIEDTDEAAKSLLTQSLLTQSEF